MRISRQSRPGKSRWQQLLLLISTALFFMMSLPTTALAQTGADDEEYNDNALEEVIVTSARRRDENIQDVPIAISYLSSDTLEDYNMLDLGDVSNMIPNSVISAGRATNSTIIAYIRGVGQNDPLWGFEPGVGVSLP